MSKSVAPSLARGVFTVPYRTPSGERTAVTITSAGTRIATVSILQAEDEAAAHAYLRRILDREDPPVRRRLHAL